MKNCATLTFVVKDMFNLQSNSILHFQMHINSLNGEYKMLSLNCFLQFVIQTKINKQTKQNKTVVKSLESL